MHITEPNQIRDGKIYLDRISPEFTKRLGITGVIVLLASLAVSFLFQDGLTQFWHSYLVSFCYFLSISLGALFFVMLQHLTRAGWSVVVRRIAELIAANIPVLALLFIPLLFGMGHLYHWTHAEAVAEDTLLQGKQPYLNIPFFLIRCTAYFGIWWFLARRFLSQSCKQDNSGSVELSLKMERLSAPAMVLFALTLTFAAFDLIMSLDPHWYSTIYGVYYFAGSMIAIFATMIVVCYFTQRSGHMIGVVTAEHYHDLGKFLFAFVFFWAYIAFSQYMLIWYANIPEETAWVLKRQTGPWLAVGLVLIFGHFVVPFIGLMSRFPKRNKNILIGWAIWMLVMHWFDLQWLIMPETRTTGVPIHLVDIGCMAGMACLYIAGLANGVQGKALVPMNDPRLAESLSFENA